MHTDRHRFYREFAQTALANTVHPLQRALRGSEFVTDWFLSVLIYVFILG